MMKWVEASQSYAATPSYGAEILALVTILAFLCVLAARLYFSWSATKRHKAPRPTNRPEKKPNPKLGSLFPHQQDTPTSMAEPLAQMNAISKVQFEKVRLLNKSEAKLLPILEDAAKTSNKGHRVMAQTCMGEVLRPSKYGSEAERKNAHASINSKRLDFAIVDRSGYLVCAVEYHGGGHHQANAFMRDAVKREALRRAGVPLIEVPEKFSTFEVADNVKRILLPEAPGSQHGKPTVNM